MKMVSVDREELEILQNRADPATMIPDAVYSPATRPVTSSHDTTRRAIILVQANDLMTAYREAVEAEVASIDKCLQDLKEEFFQGNRAISELEMENNREILETELMERRTNLVIVQEHGLSLVGELANARYLKQQDAPNWEYIERLISRYKSPQDAKATLYKRRGSDAQHRFRQRAIKAYGTKQDGDSTQEVWDCITGEWVANRESTVRAAHIMPYNVGEFNARYLFGDATGPKGHLMSAQNGIPMGLDWEVLMDSGMFTLMPVEGTNDIKIVVLADNPDRDLQELDGQLLKFNNDFRPAKRYLYFAYTVALFRRQRHERPGWWRAFDVHGSIKEMWASPGEHRCKSTLKILARQLAHLQESEISEILGPDDSTPLSCHESEQSALIANTLTVLACRTNSLA